MAIIILSPRMIKTSQMLFHLGAPGFISKTTEREVMLNAIR